MDERSQASVDPNALRALGAEFSNLASKILEMGLELDQGLARLGETFRDDHYHEFRSAFAASRQKLTAFAEEARSLVPKLNQDADDIAASQAVRLER